MYEPHFNLSTGLAKMYMVQAKPAAKDTSVHREDPVSSLRFGIPGPGEWTGGQGRAQAVAAHGRS